MFDLIVIGAGPAGASAAITAAGSGTRVLLLERGRLPRNRVCGEFVSAESLDLLARLLDSSGQDLLAQAHRIGKARVFSDGLALAAPVDPPAASIARLDLDIALWQAALNSGVEARLRVTVNAIEGRDPFRVVTSEGAFEGRAVIDASGRWSNLTPSALAAKAKPRHKWLGVKAHFAEENPSPSVDLYFFKGGYCGVQPVALHGEGKGSRINACAMVRADVASTLSEVFQQNSSLRERSRNWQQLTEPVNTSPLIFREPRPLDGHVLLAGDAAGFVDPFVGDGISLALRSGELSARSLMPFLENHLSLGEAAQAYRRDYERKLLPVFRTSSKLRHMFLLPRAVRVMFLAVLQNSPSLTRYLVKRTR
jgi:flavin-dependent dehydrogenase